MLIVYVKEDAFVAKCAAWCMRSATMAITIGQTIYLHGTSIDNFLQHKEWVAHEVAHIQQFTRCNKWLFILLYIFESIKRGYYRNKYEVEARANEKNIHLLQQITFIPHKTVV